MKNKMLLLAGSMFLAYSANAQTVSSFAGKVNTNPSTDITNSTADLADAYFYYPEGLTWDGDGNMYVTEKNKIRLIRGGKVYNRAGNLGDPSTTIGYQNGTGNAAKFASPTGAVCASNGDVYIVEEENHAVRKLTAFKAVSNGQTVSNFVGAAPVGGFGTSGYKDGAGTAARFDTPKGIVMDKNGNMYVTDFLNHCIRKISPGGQVITLAGKGMDYGNADGVGSAARFDSPYGIALLDDNNLVVTDFGNSAIRKVNLGTGRVTTICGGFGSKDGSLSDARFRAPRGIAVVAGLIYVADNAAVRVIDEKNKTVSTFAGSMSATGNKDGVGTDARFGVLYGLGYGGSDAIYVTDITNHIIKKITIDDLAPVADFSVTKANIEINEETTLSDISSGKEATQRKWTIENSAGGGSSGVVVVQGDLNASKDVTVKFSATGNYRVTLNVTNEFGNDEVSKAIINVSTVGIAEIASQDNIVIFPNPVNTGDLNIALNSGSFENTRVNLVSLDGRVLSSHVVDNGFSTNIDVSSIPSGIYLIQLYDNTGMMTKRVVIE